jgi:hypothetical protein
VIDQEPFELVDLVLGPLPRVPGGHGLDPLDHDATVPLIDLSNRGGTAVIEKLRLGEIFLWGNITHAFSSRLSSFRKRQSVHSAISWFGLDLIMPTSWRRSAKNRRESSGSNSRQLPYGSSVSV